MVGYGRQLTALAVALSGLAGFVDALGFITLGGVFVSFMSGNSTRLSVGLAEGTWGPAALTAGVIGLFLVGVVLGGVVAQLSDRSRRARKTMGAENSVFQRDGEVSVALTYMTGALVKIGQRLAAAMFGGPRWTWLPYLGLWLGLVTGAVGGAAAHRMLGLHALWIATAAAVALTLAVRHLPYRP